MGHQTSSGSLSSEQQNSKSDENGEAVWDPYSAWLRKHPSALDVFESMMKPAAGKNLVLFLDYDGTLSPIVTDPDQAFMSDKMRKAVEEVAKVFPTAIVSGRSRDKVMGFVRLNNLTYAGSHGMDILTTKGSLMVNYSHQTRSVDDKGNRYIFFQPAKNFLPQIREILEVLGKKIKNVEGAGLEDNQFCVSVHYRCVLPEEVDALKYMVESTMEAYPDFRITRGRKVMEIRPRIDWDKGRAMQYLIEHLGLGGSEDLIPMYIGDDKTDEDAFKVIQKIGRGYPIIVSSIPKETMAAYSLRDTEEVRSFLTHLVEWKGSGTASSSAPKN